MKKKNLMTVALMAMTMGLAMNVSADENAAAPKKHEAASKLSADEQAFAAKLSDQNRKAFEQFNADQKKAAMSASCGASCGKTAMAPNDAVQKVLKDQNVAATEKQAAPAAAEAKAAAPAQAK